MVWELDGAKTSNKTESRTAAGMVPTTRITALLHPLERTLQSIYGTELDWVEGQCATTWRRRRKRCLLDTEQDSINLLADNDF